MACWLKNLKKGSTRKRSARRGRGQLSIMGILMVFIMLIVYTALRPALVEIISDAKLTGTEGLIGDLFPTLILLGILGSLVLYLWPQRTQGY